MAKRMCYNCRETFRGFEGDQCGACGSYDNGPELGSEGCYGIHEASYGDDWDFGGHFEGDFDGDEDE